MTRKKKIEPAADAAPADERRMIPVDLIDPNPWNGHRPADDDLIQSVAQHGVLQNLIVRPVDDRFQVVSGSRRFDAAQATTLEEVPCLVRDLDDRQAREVTIIENLQRENLHPVDEAKAIATLISDGHTKEEVAARIGKTPAFVTRRVKLANLSEKIIEEAGDDLRRMSIRALELLATLPEAKQIDIFDGWGGVSLEADDLARQIANESRVITGAAFDCADETLVPEAGACVTCPKRTGAEPLLFDDLQQIGEGDRCLDQECYARKLDAAMAQLEAKAREKHGDKLRLATGYMPYGEEGAALRKRGVVEIGFGKFETCKKSAAHAEPAMIVAGDKAGKLVWIRKHVDDDAQGEPRGPLGDNEPTTPADPMEAKREKLDQRRYAWIAGELTKRVGGEDDDGTRRLPTEKYCTPEQMVRIAAAFGGSTMMALFKGDDCTHHGDEFAFWAQSAGVPVEKLYYHVWDAAAGALRKNMQVFKVSDIDADFVDGLKVVADLIGKSWDELWTEACEAIPEPKAWRK